MGIMTSLTVPGNLASLKPIRDHVLDAADHVGMSKKAKHRLALAVDEVATNIVMHGYEKHGIKGDIHLEVTVQPGRLTVILEDTSVPFDPHQLEPPEDLDFPAELRGIGGLGVFLALLGVDVFDYEYRDGKNRNIFIMHTAEDASAG